MRCDDQTHGHQILITMEHGSSSGLRQKKIGGVTGRPDIDTLRQCLLEGQANLHWQDAAHQHPYLRVQKSCPPE